MLHSDDHAYFSSRAAEELERGDQAANASVAGIHYQLAERYSLLAAQGTGTPNLTLIDGGRNLLADQKQTARLRVG